MVVSVVNVHLICGYKVVPNYIFVTVSPLWLMSACFSLFIHSLDGNSIGDKGAVAISEAVKTSNLSTLS